MLAQSVAPERVAVVQPVQQTQLTFSVVIVNYNGGGYLEAAVKSLKTQTFSDFELIIIDNASQDGSPDQVDLRGLADARIVRLPDNIGFSGAVNRAAQLAKGRYLALLNPDCEADPTWLEKLADAAATHPDVAMFSSTQINHSDARLIDGAGDNYFFVGIPWRGGYGHPVEDLPDSGDCFSPCGAGALIRKDTFLTVGGFDEDFFCYCEDVDLGFRMRLAGERCIYWRPALVRHVGSALTGKQSGFTIYHGTRNRIWTYLKNMPPAGLVLTLPLHFALSIYLLLRTPQGAQRDAIGKGLRDSLKDLGGIWHKRKLVQNTRKIGTLQVMLAMTWNPMKLHRRFTDIQN